MMIALASVLRASSRLLYAELRRLRAGSAGSYGARAKIFDERTIRKLVFFLLLYDNVSLQLRLT